MNLVDEVMIGSFEDWIVSVTLDMVCLYERRDDRE
jgi:hypothetical protein